MLLSLRFGYVISFKIKDSLTLSSSFLLLIVSPLLVPDPLAVAVAISVTCYLLCVVKFFFFNFEF